jgi:hypothetical protein
MTLPALCQPISSLKGGEPTSSTQLEADMATERTEPSQQPQIHRNSFLRLGMVIAATTFATAYTMKELRSWIEMLAHL